jgi:glycosyltransferase involved in cell wall biosynthesis
MPDPLLSVIVPTYNCEAFIGDALKSILSQGYAPMEIVIADDGSTDATLSVVDGLGDDRLRVVRQANRGPAAARNLAVRASRGEYLAFLDGDDLWLPGKLAAQMAYLRAHPKAPVVYGNWLVWEAGADGKYHESDLHVPAEADDQLVEADNSGWVYPKLLLDSIIHIIAAVIHRSVYDKVDGFDESLRTGSDWDFWLRVAQHYPAAKLQKTVAVYRQNPASVTYTVRRENNGYLLLKRALDRYGLGDDAGQVASGSAVARRLSDLAFTHGYRHYWHGDVQVAAASFATAWKHYPVRIKAAAYLAAALAKRIGIGPGRREP